MKTVYILYCNIPTICMSRFPLYNISRRLHPAMIDAHLSVMLYAWSKDISMIEAFLSTRNRTLFTLKEREMGNKEYKKFKSEYSECKLDEYIYYRFYRISELVPADDNIDKGLIPRYVKLVTPFFEHTAIAGDDYTVEFTSRLSVIALFIDEMFTDEACAKLSFIGYFDMAVFNLASGFFTIPNGHLSTESCFEIQRHKENPQLTDTDYIYTIEEELGEMIGYWGQSIAGYEMGFDAGDIVVDMPSALYDAFWFTIKDKLYERKDEYNEDL